MEYGFKGWLLVSLYKEHSGSNAGLMYVDFAHYTGRPSRTGGHEYDKTLSGHIPTEDFRKILRRRLTLKVIPKEER